MTITLHWWMVSLAVLIVGLIIANYPHANHQFVRRSHAAANMGIAIVVTAIICGLGNML